MSARPRLKAKSLPPPTLRDLAVSNQARVAAELRLGDRVIIEVRRYKPGRPNNSRKLRMEFDATLSARANEGRLAALNLAVASMLETDE